MAEQTLISDDDGRDWRLFMLWDDTYYHEVWNESDDVRLALCLDIWRPHMPPDMWVMSRAILALTQVCDRLRGLAGKYRK